MPLYEYQCDSCGHRFEVIQKFSDPPIEVCPRCQGVVQKLPSSPAIQFKGSGWYITDYARAAKPETPGASTDKAAEGSAGSIDAKGGSKSEGKAETKVESKTERKAEPKTETKGEGKPSSSTSSTS